MPKHISVKVLTKAIKQTKQSTAPSPEKAERLLQNIFKECGMDPNVTLPSKTEPKHSMTRGTKALIVTASLAGLTAVAATVVSLTATPSITRIDYNSDTYAQEISVSVYVNNSKTVDNFIVVTPKGEKYKEQTASDEYNFKVAENGTYTIIVQDSKGHENEKSFAVSNIDNVGPQIDQTTYVDKKLSIVVSDTMAGVDFDRIELVCSDQTKTAPISVDPITGTVVFENPHQGDLVYIYDKLGNLATYHVEEILVAE